MRRQKRNYIDFFAGAGYCCLMAYMYSATDIVWFGAGAVTAFAGYSFSAFRIYKERKFQLLPDR